MTTKTYRLRGSEIEGRWHVIDAAGRPLGRVAAQASSLLLGKHKPTYEPHLTMGDFVVIVNAGKVAVTGNKATAKVYYRHSGYPGGLKQRTFQEQMDRDPRRPIETAVRGMLPHNARGRQLFRRLKVYAGPEHPHEAQVRAGEGARARRSARREDADQPPSAQQAVDAPAAAAQAQAAEAQAAEAQADAQGADDTTEE